MYVEWQPSKILRRDRQKTVTVSATLEPGLTPLGVFEQIRTWIAREHPRVARRLPLGVRRRIRGVGGGERVDRSQAADRPALIIVLLLVGQFNSMRRPLIILLTIPLGLIGVGFGLVVADSIMGFMTFLGIISLCGIVINNAIVLLDRIKIEIEQNGRDPTTR